MKGGKAEAAKESKRLEDESNGKFNFYIHKWMESVFQLESPTLPSSLPSFSPVHTILENSSGSQCLPGAFEMQDTSFSPSSKGTASAGIVQRTTSTVTGTGIVYSTLLEEHKANNFNEFERPARTQKTIQHLEAVGLLDCCVLIKARKAKTREIRLVHSQQHIDYVDQISFFTSLEKPSSSSIGEDLYCSEKTSEAARMACGCAVEAAKAVVHGKAKNAYALVRPPGHHASAETASGFCFYNNVAVAARVAQEELSRLHPEKYAQKKKPRVLIVDWDVHHCNGTEDIFLEDPSVLVISIHQYSNRRGHVFRKKPKVLPANARKNPSNEMNLDELQQLILNDSQSLDLLPKDERKENNATILDPIPTSQGEIKVEDDLGLLPRSKRARKEVDYNKLADELGVDDAIAADVFGVPKSPHISSSGSTSSSTLSGYGESKGDSHEGLQKAIEDSEGFSEEESASEHELFYPGTGHIKTIGGEMNEDARGRNINLACPTVEMGDLEYLQMLHEVIVPCGREFHPDIVFISCGFDSARGDLLGSMNLSCTGFYAMTSVITKEFGTVVVVLEGGYRVSNVARCSEAVLRALLESSGSPIPKKSKMLWFQTKELIDNVKMEHRPYWKCLQD